VSCVLVSGERRWNVIGTYIPPSETDGETVNFINEAVQYRGTKDPYILLGDLNVDVDHPKDIRDDNILSMMFCLDWMISATILLTLKDVGHGQCNVKIIIDKARWITFLCKNFMISNGGQLKFLELTQIIVQLLQK
jgi:hypothetical protein